MRWLLPLALAAATAAGHVDPAARIDPAARVDREARLDPAAPLAVAAAADLQSALPPLVEQFEGRTGHRVTLTFGSSGNFYTQIRNGAPFDVFLSADTDYPRQLDAAGLAEHDSFYEYAMGRLVLWVRSDSALDVQRGLSLVADASVGRVAVANPAHAPYGRAAVAALRRAGLYEAARRKLVFGENVSQAAQFAQSGNAEAGLIPLSLALAPAMKAAGRYTELAAGTYPPIAQAAIVIGASKQKAAARQFVEYLKTPAARKQLESFGFATGGR